MTTISTHPLTGGWIADREHSTFQAGVRHMGVGSFRTTFEDVTARLYERADGGFSLEGRVQVASIAIRTPAEFRAHVVDSDDFFAAATHPDIVFGSDDVRLAGDGTAEVPGELTIKGTTQPVLARGTYVAPVRDIYGGLRCALDLTATIDRRAFGLTWQAQLPNGGDVVSWEVEVTVHLEFVQD
jgi:polyisoprenoid-binding protein YceI